MSTLFAPASQPVSLAPYAGDMSPKPRKATENSLALMDPAPGERATPAGSISRSRTDSLPIANPPRQRATAETMATKQRDISVSEFFAKNRHLLGFDNPRKALLTTVKEAVDNSLDACEEAGILPDITVAIEDLQPDRPAATKSSRYRITIVDNGPGIVRKQVENIFGRLLYGSKFHRLKMSRGQQGIGISAAGMYGLITTGKPMVIHTKPKATAPAHHIELAMNTKTNRAEVTVDIETDDFPVRRLRDLSSGTRELTAQGQFLADEAYVTGTSVSIELEGRYQRGRGSVDEFLELSAIANPHARIVFVPPTRESGAEEDEAPLLKGKRGGAVPSSTGVGTTPGGIDPGGKGVPPVQHPTPQPSQTTELRGVTIFPRAVEELPPETKEIQPHPRGIELGILLQMLRDKGEGSLYNFLQEQFSRVSSSTAADIVKRAGVTTRTRVNDVDHALAEKLFKQLQDAKLPPPPTDCLAPIGVRQLLAGMLKGVRAEFYAASSREAAVYRGRPFQIEAAIAYGGELPADEPSRVIRFANRVPLLYQQSACSSFKAVLDTNWKNYDLQQPRGSAPVGPLVILIHMASVWVPFTSESKEAIADYDEIRKEMKLALMECGRKLGTYVRKRQKMRREAERRDVFERYIGEIAKAINDINGTDPKKVYEALLEQARARTAIADAELDEDGRVRKQEQAEASDEDGVIIIPASFPQSMAPHHRPPLGDAPPFELSNAEAAAIEVNARRGSDEDDLSTTRVSPAKKSATQPLAPKGNARNKQPGRQSPSPAKSTAPKPKPKLRLVGGKLVPVDNGPQLF
ncbi:MAG: DNA topoisomerase VI subunit B [Phycisphaerales bacterium]|nr:DNA topoisomerase VI subunit B [Phycisphaerales bacterium]